MEWILKNKILFGLGAILAAFSMYSHKRDAETPTNYTRLSGTYCFTETVRDNQHKNYLVIDKDGNFIIYSRNCVVAQGQYTHNEKQKRLVLDNGYSIFYKDGYRTVTLNNGKERQTFEKISDILIYINVNATQQG